MTVTRRTVLKAATGGMALASVAPVPAGASAVGQSGEFDGPGLYLYPAWGEPRAYLVIPTGPGHSVLEFRDPVTSRLCWTQSLTLTGPFAAKLS